MSKLNPFYKKINYTFKNEQLINNALLHASAIKIKQNYILSERYEFLGDRILNFIIAENLLLIFPDAVEGYLAKRHAYLVSSKLIAMIMESIGLRHYIIHNLKDNIIPERVLSSAGEAFIAALFLDSGIDTARSVILDLWKPYIQNDSIKLLDPKSKLQEYAQQYFNKIPLYNVIMRSGTDHQPEFQVKVSLSEGLIAYGQGASKKTAERDAALKLLTDLIPHESQ